MAIVGIALIRIRSPLFAYEAIVVCSPKIARLAKVAMIAKLAKVAMIARVAKTTMTAKASIATKKCSNQERGDGF